MRILFSRPSQRMLAPGARGVRPSRAGYLILGAGVASKAERFEEFLRRLREADPVSSAEEALELLSNILNGVEDEMTDVPLDPTRWQTDGRMYPPQSDSRRTVAERSNVARYRSRAHNTYIGDNGAIEIVEIDGPVIFQKAGANGKHVWQN